MKWFILLVCAAVIAAASAFFFSLLRSQTHNIGVLFGDALVGAVVFFVTLLIGYLYLVRK
jgi:hypothetical protein